MKWLAAMVAIDGKSAIVASAPFAFSVSCGRRFVALRSTYEGRNLQSRVDQWTSTGMEQSLLIRDPKINSRRTLVQQSASLPNATG
jgi:hypothetical protein